MTPRGTMLLGLGTRAVQKAEREESWQPTLRPPPHLFTEDQAATHKLLQGPPPSLPHVGGGSREDQSPRQREQHKSGINVNRVT